jgi:hypothetical protein
MGVETSIGHKSESFNHNVIVFNFNTLLEINVKFKVTRL